MISALLKPLEKLPYTVVYKSVITFGKKKGIFLCYLERYEVNPERRTQL